MARPGKNARLKRGGEPETNDGGNKRIKKAATDRSSLKRKASGHGKRGHGSPRGKY